MGRPSKTFAAKAAAAALAFSIAQGSTSMALAQEPGETSPSTDVATITTQVANDVAAQAPAPQIVSNWNVHANPLIPIGLIAGLGFMYAAGSLLMARRRVQGGWLRAAAGGVMILTLVNPEVMEEEREIVPTEIAIVIDKTASQALGDRTAETTEMYEQLVAKLANINGVNIRTIEIDSNEGGIATDGTHLFEHISTNLTDVPRDRLGGVIILSDGQIHDMPESTDILGKDVPLHVLVSGSESDFDRNIIIEEAPGFGLVNTEQTIRFRVQDEGTEATASDKVLVSIKSDGEEIGTQLVTPGEVAEVTLKIPHTGTNIVELSVEELEGELTPVNNRITTSIEGIRENLKVLLVSGQPNAGGRVWRDLLKADPGTDLVHFTILRPPLKQDTTPLRELALIAFPARELFHEKINDFDLIIFDHYQDQGILPRAYFQNIANYARNGGALLVVPGENYSTGGGIYQTPLQEILPSAPAGAVDRNPYRPQINEIGERHPVTRHLQNDDKNEGNWGRWFSVTTTQTTSGQTLMETEDGTPLLVLNREGKGRVATLMSDNAWLWSRGYEGGGPHADMLRRTIQWLMKNPSLEEEAITMRMVDGKLEIRQQTITEEAGTVILTSPSGKTQTITLEQTGNGLYSATVIPEELGLYNAKRAGDEENPISSFINIGTSTPKEFAQTLSTTEIAAPFTAQTGGTTLRMQDTDGSLRVPDIQARTGEQAQDSALAGDSWLGIKMTDATILKDTSNQPLIPSWLGFLAAVGLLAGAWYQEGDKKLFGRRRRKKAMEPTPPAP